MKELQCSACGYKLNLVGSTSKDDKTVINYECPNCGQYKQKEVK